MDISNTNRHSILVVAVLAIGVCLLALPAIPQSASYHQMADRRSWMGIPNSFNVLSNLPFAIVGVLGLATVLASPQSRFRDPSERLPYLALLVGVTLTSVGSSYYHLNPDNARLVWDRLPMAVGFMGLLAATLTERVGLRVGRRLLGPLLLIGIAGVAYWYWSELHNRGDLRLYLAVQFGSLLLVVLSIVLYPARYAGTAYLVTGLAAYGLAKIFEACDQTIFALGHVISGHTLKHLAAVLSVSFLVRMLRARAATTPSTVHTSRACEVTV